MASFRAPINWRHPERSRLQAERGISSAPPQLKKTQARPLLKFPVANVCKVASNRRRSRHHGANQMRPPPTPLPPFKIAVAGRGATLSRLLDVRIHSQTHGASRLAPLKPGILKNPVQAFLLRHSLHGLRPRYHHGPHLRIYVMSLRDPSRRPQIFDPRIRARSNEHPINPDVLNLFPGIEAHVLQCQLRCATVRTL